MTPCPFKVGDRIREMNRADIILGYHESPVAIVATVTAITPQGFQYVYDTPIPNGRIAWGSVQTGGECYPEGYHTWRKVDT